MPPPGDNFRDTVEQVHIDTPAPGTYTVEISHKGFLDGGGPQLVSLVVSGNLDAINIPPTITSAGSTTAIVGQAYGYDADDTVEASGSTPITFSLLIGPVGMSVSAGGLVSWTPAPGQEGMHAVDIEAQNMFGTDTQSFTINVSPAPLLVDDFDDGDFVGWSIVDEGTSNAPSVWSASSGVMIQSANIGTPGPTTSKLGTYAQFDAGVLWTDYRLTLTMKSTDNDALGVMFRVQGANDYYRFSWDAQGNYRRVVKNVGGVFTLLAEDSVNYVTGQSYQVEITVQGSAIEVRIDGGVVFSGNDSEFSSGTIALYSWSNNGSQFDDVVVDNLAVNQPPTITSVGSTTATEEVAYAYDADNTVEASGTEPITFSLVVGPAGMSVSAGGLVTWTPATGEAGMHGVQIDAQNAFGSDSESFTIDVTPGQAPTITSVASTTASVGVAYAYDLDGTVQASGSTPITFSLLNGPVGMSVSAGGLVSWTPVPGQEGMHAVDIDAQNMFGTDTQSFTIDVSGAPPVLLVDDFDDGDFVGWSIVDEGTSNAPSVWSASSGVMIQSANIGTPGPTTSKLGTYAQFDAGVLWTDYRLTLTMKSTDNDALGVMFRVQGANDYYRFSWDAQGNYRRVVKNVGGVFTLLAEDSVNYVTGQSYQVEITVQGSAIEVRIDGGVVFSGNDSEFSSGTIALYSWSNNGSQFDDVVVESL